MVEGEFERTVTHTCHMLQPVHCTHMCEQPECITQDKIPDDELNSALCRACYSLQTDSSNSWPIINSTHLHSPSLSPDPITICLLTNLPPGK